MAVRRVRRVIRKIDPWTVLKVGLVLNFVAALIFVLGVWVAWSIAVQRGIPTRLSEMLEQLTIVFAPEGELYFRVVLLAAVVWTVLASAAMTLGAVLYNLISDLVGGIELVVLEETHSVATPAPTRPRPVIHVGENGPPTPPPSMTTGETVPHSAVTSTPES